MDVAMMQPAFLPWQGFFELIEAADLFIVLDDFQYCPRSWHQRNRLFVNAGQVGWYTAPVITQGVFPMTLNAVRVDPGELWRDKMWRRLEQNYRKAPFWGDVAPRVREWLFAGTDSLAGFDMGFVGIVCEMLGIGTEMRRSSEWPSETRRSERVLEILQASGATRYLSARGSFGYMAEDGVFPAPGIEVVFQDFRPRPYPQAGSPGGFVPFLSVLDALLNVGPERTGNLVKGGTPEWTAWADMTAARVSDV